MAVCPLIYAVLQIAICVQKSRQNIPFRLDELIIKYGGILRTRYLLMQIAIDFRIFLHFIHATKKERREFSLRFFIVISDFQPVKS